MLRTIPGTFAIHRFPAVGRRERRPGNGWQPGVPTVGKVLITRMRSTDREHVMSAGRPDLVSVDPRIKWTAVGRRSAGRACRTGLSVIVRSDPQRERIHFPVNTTAAATSTTRIRIWLPGPEHLGDALAQPLLRGQLCRTATGQDPLGLEKPLPSSSFDRTR